MLRKTIARTAQEMEPLQGAWQALSAPYTIFQRCDLNLLAARHFADCQPPLVIYCENDLGAAIIPACIDVSRQRISLLGEELFDYRGLLSAGDESALHEAWQTLIDFAGEHDLGFGFHALRNERVSNFAANQIPISPFTSAPFCLTADLTKFHHPRLDSKLRRLGREGIAFRKHSTSTPLLVREIYVRKSTEPHSLFGDDARIDFCCSMATTLGTACEVFTLESQAAIVAALITYRDGDWRRFYTTYFDRSWAKLSPGQTLLYEVVRQSLNEGLNCDLMTGDQPYKVRLATGSAPLFKVDITAAEMRALGKHALEQSA